MPVVELMGLPRSGKSTVVKRIQEIEPQFKIHHETYESAPMPEGGFESSDQRFRFNFMHLQKIAAQVEGAFKDSTENDNVHIIERGLLDRKTVFKALWKFEAINENLYQEAADFLTKILSNLDKNFGAPHGYNKAYLFNPPPEISLGRITRPKPGNIMQNMSFLYLLGAEYNRSLLHHPDITQLPVITYDNVDQIAKKIIHEFSLD